MKFQPIVVALCGALLVGCSNPGVQASQASAASSSHTEQTTTSEAPKLHKPGEPVQSGGVTLTLEAVVESDYLDFDSESSYVLPRDDAKFVTVVTTVENTGKKSINLGCGLRFRAHLINSDEQEYDPSGQEPWLPGNPACHEPINPGFSVHMKWAFEVPKTMKATAFGFADEQREIGTLKPTKLTLISLDGAATTDPFATETADPAEPRLEELLRQHDGGPREDPTGPIMDEIDEILKSLSASPELDPVRSLG